ncbi:pilus assembly PilX family protein [Aeromonas rivipollensis]|mgnify:FL=1|uniref:pilus assembly PilX family protein n=1 Tax=Aeromonas rivipollensis TaxID=948519 RepID=UPI0026EC2F70|nr:pilus assembly protein [Aeromonas media]
MRQRGMVLILSLIFLTVVSLLAMAAMRGGVLQEKMAGNYQESLQALQAAEAALRGAERYIEGGTAGPFNNSEGLYELVDTAMDPLASTTSWRSHNTGGQGPSPEYFIELLPYTQSLNENLAADEPQGERRLYRITARGYGLSNESFVLLQSTYSR